MGKGTHLRGNADRHQMLKAQWNGHSAERTVSPSGRTCLRNNKKKSRTEGSCC